MPIAVPFQASFPSSGTRLFQTPTPRCSDGTVALTSMASAPGLKAPPPAPNPTYSFRPHAGGISTVKYVSLGSQGAIASGTQTGQLSLWDLGSKRQAWQTACSSALVAVDCTLHGKLLCHCRNSSVEVWDLEGQIKECTVAIEDAGFCRLSVLSSPAKGGCFIPSSFTSTCFAVSASSYGKVNIYDTTVQHSVSSLTAKEPKSRGMCMCVRSWCSSSGVVHLLGGFEDGSVVLWDCRNSSPELASLKLFSEPVMCMDFDDQRLCGVCGSPLKALEVFSLSLDQGSLEKSYGVELRNAGVGDVCIRQDKKIMASGGWDGRIRVFGWKKGKPLAILNYHTATVNCVTFAGPAALPEHADLLVCGSNDERISLWKLY